jgi:hypothetical protein
MPATDFRFIVRSLGRALALLALTTVAVAPAAALEPGEFDPAPFDSLLRTYVRDGAVDYAAWKEDGLASLDRFLDDAATHDLTKLLGKEPRAGFLINAYNAWAIRQIVASYPIDRVQDIPGFYEGNRRRIAGEERSLAEIEATLDAMLPHQPDYIFALSSGAADMPALAGEAYRSDDFLRRIRRAALAYLGGLEPVVYDHEKNVLRLPPPFRGHVERFEALPKGLSGFLSPYIPLADMVALQTDAPKIEIADSPGTLRRMTPAPGDSSGAKQ